MQLNNYEQRNDLLMDWIIESTPKGCSALDVGANDGEWTPQVARMVAHASRLAGVDPDEPKLALNKFITERYGSTLEDAQIEPETFDVLYSIFVLEHVVDPDRFIEAASQVLKPGGSLFFITPNKQHYFAKAASFFLNLGLQDKALGIVRSKELIESYHYPAVYRLNQPKDIERVGRKFGFNQFEYRYSESLGEIETYFPGPTKLFPRAWEKLVAASGKEHLLLNLMGRMVKAK